MNVTVRVTIYFSYLATWYKNVQISSWSCQGHYEIRVTFQECAVHRIEVINLVQDNIRIMRILILINFDSVNIIYIFWDLSLCLFFFLTSISCNYILKMPMLEMITLTWLLLVATAKWVSPCPNHAISKISSLYPANYNP